MCYNSNIKIILENFNKCTLEDEYERNEEQSCFSEGKYFFYTFLPEVKYGKTERQGKNNKTYIC